MSPAELFKMKGWIARALGLVVWFLLLIQSWVRNAGWETRLLLQLFSLWSRHLSFLRCETVSLRSDSAGSQNLCSCHPSPNLLREERSITRYQRARLYLCVHSADAPCLVRMVQLGSNWGIKLGIFFPLNEIRVNCACVAEDPVQCGISWEPGTHFTDKGQIVPIYKNTQKHTKNPC